MNSELLNGKVEYKLVFYVHTIKGGVMFAGI